MRRNALQHGRQSAARALFSVLLLAIVETVLAGPVYGQDNCSDILQYGVFENYQTLDVRYLLLETRHLYCEATSSSQNKEVSAGVSAVVKLIPVSASASERDSEAWKKDICKLDWYKLVDWTKSEVVVRQASKTIVEAWRSCMEHRQGVTAGILFSTPKDFILQVQINGLDAIPRLRYLNTGITFSPRTAATLENFKAVAGQPTRTHIFSGHRRTDEAFTIVIGSRPSQVTLSVAERNFQPKKSAILVSRTALADINPSRVVGIYSPRNCYGNPVVKIADGKTYPDSIVFPPDLNYSTVIEWEVPRGAKTLVFDGAGFCHEPGSISGCFDSNNGEAAAYVYVSIDGKQVFGIDLNGRHDLPPSYKTQGGPFSFSVEGHHLVRFETTVPITRWCAHSTILNPYFDP